MRIVFALCQVDYSGRLDAHLPLAKRVLMVKADGAVLVHCDGGSYKPLNWMSAPCVMGIKTGTDLTDEEQSAGVLQKWVVKAKRGEDQLVIQLHEIYEDYQLDLGLDPGLQKDGVEAHLQKLLAQQVELIEPGARLVRREYPTAIGPVDLMLATADGRHVAVEVKRRGEIDGVEQLTRYLELLGRDPLLQPLSGVFAAQVIKPQARVIAEDRGIKCVVLDYDAMRGVDDREARLF